MQPPNKPKLILIHGYIGSGKTTFSKHLAHETGALRLSTDEWIIHFYGKAPPQSEYQAHEISAKSMIKHISSEFLTRGHDVILDFGFWRRSERDEYRAFAEKVGASTLLYTLNCPYNTAKQRALTRTLDETKTALFIDENAYENLIAFFEPLQNDEEAIEVPNL